MTVSKIIIARDSSIFCELYTASIPSEKMYYPLDKPTSLDVYKMFL